MLTPTYLIADLPPPVSLDTPRVLKALADAHRRLAEMKGRATAIPNQGILIDTLALQEAKASSEIENIVTTQDELFQASLFPDGIASAAAKEVANYRDALRSGFARLQREQNLLTNNNIVEMFQVLKRTTETFRKHPGTALRNETAGTLVYVPPQAANDIISHMTALETFINDDAL